MAGNVPSVKDLRVLQEPSNDRAGRGVFVFSNRYSVFDWGEMPDHIQDKGTALCVVGAYFFEKLNEAGIDNHYIGLRDETGDIVQLHDLEKPTNEMVVRLVRVLPPPLKSDGGYDYSLYKKVRKNYLIPLEVIYRNALPEGSSVFKRLKKGELSLEQLGLREIPAPGSTLERPLFDLSTKLENIDRYLSWNEAREISGLDEGKFNEMREILFQVNKIISREVKRLGLRNDDGKIELAVDENGRIMVVDVLGTLDECRFSWNGFQVSKEILRIYYRKTPWFNAITEAKSKDSVRWKEIAGQNPPSLPEDFKKAVENTYRAFANDLTGKKWFPEAPTFETAVSHLKELTERF